MIHTNNPHERELNEGDAYRREKRREDGARVGERVPTKLPDNWADVMASSKVGWFLEMLISDKNYWLKREKGEAPWCTNDTPEIRALSGRIAGALGPFISEAMELKARHEARAKEIEENRS